MLFNLVLDPAGLHADHSSRAERDVALEIVRNFGVLFISKNDLGVLKECLSGDELKRWTEAIAGSPYRMALRNLHEDPTITVEGLGTEEPGLVILGPESSQSWAEQLGVNAADLVDGLPGSKLHAVTTNVVTQAPPYQERREWSSSTLIEPQSGTEVWEQRLRALVAWSTEVKVVDRYGLQEPQLGQMARNGIPWLLDRIASASPSNESPKLTAIVQTPEPPFDDQDGIDQIADDLWRRADGALRELELIFIDDLTARAHQHDRYLRFSMQRGRSSRLVTLGNGLDRLSERPIRPPMAFTYKLQGKDELTAYQANEDRLRKASILASARP